MSRARFGVLLALLVLVVAVGSFALVLTLLDDDQGPQADLTTTTTLPTTTAPAGLVTPAFVAIVSSDADEGTAQAMAAELTERGYDGNVLRSDEYESLTPGFWVAYVGPFADAQGAISAVDQLKVAGYGSAYQRCVGTDAECPGD